MVEYRIHLRNTQEKIITGWEGKNIEGPIEFPSQVHIGETVILPSYMEEMRFMSKQVKMQEVWIVKNVVHRAGEATIVVLTPVAEKKGEIKKKRVPYVRAGHMGPLSI